MSTPKRELAIFIMGGTIDSRNAPEHDGQSVVLKESLVKKYINILPLNIKIIIHMICMKDSRSITQEDKELLTKKILEAGFQYNLITHGTYTMRETGEYLCKQDVLHDKLVGLTGSMGTLLGTIDDEGRLMPSDGQFNLGYAIAELFHLQNGVYQFMNGDVFKLPDEWWSHTPEGTFYKKT